MGDLAGGDEPSHEDGAREAAPQHDVARIADAVRESVDAGAALISRVVDDDWLEIVAVSGAVDGADPTGRRWPRADLARYLDDAQRRGRIHVTRRRAVSYVEVPDGAPFAEDDATILLAPLHQHDGDLVGVLTTVGYVDIDQLPPGACELVELYADQARLALDLLHEHHLFAEHLRLSDTAQSLLYLALEQPDVPSLLDAVAAPIAAMMRAGAVWTCAEIASGAHAEAASYPAEVAGRLGADICTLVEPMVATCWTDDTTADRRGLAAARSARRVSPVRSGRCSRRSAAARRRVVRCSCSGAPTTSRGPSASERRWQASAAGWARWSSSSRRGGATGISWRSCGSSTSTGATSSPR